MEDFFSRVDRFNDSVSAEWLTQGFETAGITETKYDPYEMQDLWTEYRTKNRHCHTDSPSQYRTVKYIISHRIHLVCPKVLGNRYTESGTASHTESQNQKLYTAACSHTCQRFRPKNLSYDRRIYNIIRLLQ